MHHLLPNSCKFEYALQGPVCLVTCLCLLFLSTIVSKLTTKLLYAHMPILSLQMMACIGEQFTEGDEICGIVVNVRARQDRLCMWTKTASNEAAQVGHPAWMSHRVVVLHAECLLQQNGCAVLPTAPSSCIAGCCA